MPVLTRSAQRRLNETEGDVGDAHRALALRESVTSKADAVWAYRGGIDVYTLASRPSTETPQVDHITEIQLIETSLAAAFASNRGKSGSMATSAAVELLRSRLNSVVNLNCTSAKVNQAKRGPFTAALNRIQSDRLRDVTLEQLARQGRAKWLVDQGIWARIESGIVESFDAVKSELDDIETLPDARLIVQATAEDVERVFSRLGIQ
jgi:hypothetical protein